MPKYKGSRNSYGLVCVEPVSTKHLSLPEVSWIEVIGPVRSMGIHANDVLCDDIAFHNHDTACVCLQFSLFVYILFSASHTVRMKFPLETIAASSALMLCTEGGIVTLISDHAMSGQSTPLRLFGIPPSSLALSWACDGFSNSSAAFGRQPN